MKISWRKRHLLLLIPVFVAVVEFGPRLVAGPQARTKLFFAIERQWHAHWPFTWGADLAGDLLGPALTPFAPVWFEMQPNVKLFLDPADLGPRIILDSGKYEPDSFAIIRDHLPPGGTMIDVGAAFGVYSLMAAPVLGESGHIIAVEPNPEALVRLRTNISASLPRIVRVAPVACSDAEGTLDLYVAPKSNYGETSFSKTNASQEGAVSHVYKVRTRPLDDIVSEQGLTRVDSIKLDVEGAELLVLKGAQKTLDRFHPMLLIELVERQLRAMGTSSEELKGWLRQHGYREGRHYDVNYEFLPEAPVATH